MSKKAVGLAFALLGIWNLVHLLFENLMCPSTPKSSMTSPGSDPLVRAMEIHGQSCQQRPHGAWEVTAPCEPTEWPAFEMAFNGQLREGWQRRVSSQVSVVVHESTIPHHVRGKKNGELWDATLETVVVECRELVAYFGLEARH